MLVRKKKKHFKFKVFLLIVLMVIAVGVFLIDRIIDKKIESIAKVECESYADQIINDAAAYCIDKFSDISFVDKSYDQSRITQISVNAEEVNAFKSLMTEEINKMLISQSSHEFKISLSTVLGSNIFSGIGPEIEMYFQKEGSVNVSIDSGFSEGGVNQTVHRITVDVSVTLLSVTPAGNFPFDYSTEFLLSETVIVGQTPSFYAQIPNT